MARIRRIKGGMRRASTTRKGHYRSKPRGGVTYVHPHNMNFRKRNYSHVLVHSVPVFRKSQRSNIWPQSPQQSEPSYIDEAVNESLRLTSATFPQYAPIIETGRILYNNREKVKNVVNIIFSDKSTDRKLDEIIELTKKLTLSSAKSNLSNFCARKLTEIIDNNNGFSVLDNKLGLELGFRTEPLFKDFFQSSVEDLIKRSI